MTGIMLHCMRNIGRRQLYLVEKPFKHWKTKLACTVRDDTLVLLYAGYCIVMHRPVLTDTEERSAVVMIVICNVTIISITTIAKDCDGIHNANHEISETTEFRREL